MLNATLLRPFCYVSPFDIPHIIVRKDAFCFPILPISWCEIAYFRVRYGAFQPPKQAILQAEMVLFAM